MPTLSNVFGWVPGVKQGDHPDTPPKPSHPTPSLATFQVQSSSVDATTRPSSPEPLSPASSASSLSFDNTFQSHPVVRRGDPSWVARPRNPFIIFRCEYSREHTKGGRKRVRRLPGISADKTLSKRAGDAWKLLPFLEKERFRKLAEEEKVEHARMHPNYRFRPTKKVVGHKKKAASVSRSTSQSMVSSSLSAMPTVLAPSPRHPLPPLTPPPPPADIPTVKTGRRRSASVPTYPYPLNMHYPFITASWADHQPTLSMKRSRSVMANRPPLLSSSMMAPFEGQSFDPRLLTLDSAPSGYFTPEESLGAVQDTSQGMFFLSDQYSASNSPVVSHSTQLSSSLYSWNSSPLVEHQPLQSHGSFSGYHSASSGVSPGQLMTNYSNSDDQWASTSLEQSYTSTAHSTLGLEPDGSVFSPLTLFNENHQACIDGAYPMADYSQALDPSPVENPEDAMNGLNINDYIQYP